MCAILYEYGAFDQLSVRPELLAALPVVMDLFSNFHIFEILPKSHSHSLGMQTGLGRSKLIDHQLALGLGVISIILDLLNSPKKSHRKVQKSLTI